MSDAIRVLVLGTGQMGAGIAGLLLNKGGMELVGAFARRAGRAGIDLGQAIGLERDLGVVIDSDLEAVICRCRPHIAIQATCSTVADAFGELSILLEHGIPVISIAEQMAWPAATSAELAGKLRPSTIRRVCWAPESTRVSSRTCWLSLFPAFVSIFSRSP